jgi:hypothetical protein
MSHRNTEASGRGCIAFPAILLAAALCLMVACQREPRRPAPTATAPDNVDPAGVAFGYTDSTGKKLLMLNDDNLVLETAKAQAMTRAVCSEGRVFPIRYLQLQKRTAADTGRQSVYNFSNDEGHLFELTGDRGKLPDPYFGETCLLLPDGYLQRFPIARNELSRQERDALNDTYAAKMRESEDRKQPMDFTPFQPAGEFAKSAVARIEKEKGRKAKLYFPLYSIGAAQQIATVEFTPAGNDLLASVVFAEPNRLSFFDMPASKNGNDCWRADDNCVLGLGDGREMEVHAVFGAPGEQLIFFTWLGPEGQTIVLFQAKGGLLVDVKRAYRYEAPS